jgi:hypothetical protein
MSAPPKATSHLAHKAGKDDEEIARDTSKYAKLRPSSVFIRMDQILIVIPAYGGFTLSEPEAGTYLPNIASPPNIFEHQLMRSLQADLGLGR